MLCRIVVEDAERRAAQRRDAHFIDDALALEDHVGDGARATVARPASASAVARDADLLGPERGAARPPPGATPARPAGHHHVPHGQRHAAVAAAAHLAGQEVGDADEPGDERVGRAR